MKVGIIASLIAFFIITIGGCTTTYKQMKSWKGRTVNDLYWDFGKADKVEQVNTHERVYIYFLERTDDGQVKTCTKKFYTRNNGHAEVIIDTSYTDCHFITLK
jgi:hypothetical protein